MGDHHYHSAMGSTKFDIERFSGENDFSLWRIKMKVLLIHQGVEDAQAGERKLPATWTNKEKKNVMNKNNSLIILSLGDEVLKEFVGESGHSQVPYSPSSLHIFLSFLLLEIL